MTITNSESEETQYPPRIPVCIIGILLGGVVAYASRWTPAAVAPEIFWVGIAESMGTAILLPIAIYNTIRDRKSEP